MSNVRCPASTRRTSARRPAITTQQQEVDLALDANRASPAWDRVARAAPRSRAPEPAVDAHKTCASSSALAQERRPAASPCVVQKKSTPLRKPRNSGGSPSGVSAPPMLATRKMKNTTTCARCLRLSLARSSGRISSIDAPVVPITLASTRAQARAMPVLSAGEPCEIAADVDAARHREQREQQDDERQVFEQAACARTSCAATPTP